MLHWDDYFGAGQSASGTKSETVYEPKTNMALLLTPWIVFWIAAAINSFWGSRISIAVCVLIPGLMHRTKTTIYDKLSCLGVGGCSIAMLAGALPVLVLPLFYFLFGLMWCVSCFTKTPLTAHYSKNSYNGDAALRNPIFMKTNRILTAAWGILYLFTPNLDIFHHADGGWRFCRCDQFCSSGSYGRINRMVSEMVSEACGKRKMIFEKGGLLLCWGSI